MFKKILASMLLVAALLVVGGQDNTAEASWYARVVNCEEWISLRAQPSTAAQRLAAVPLGAIILITDRYDDGYFVSAQYNGLNGYVLKEFLTDAEK